MWLATDLKYLDSYHGWAMSEGCFIFHFASSPSDVIILTYSDKITDTVALNVKAVRHP